jgi:hypothetical protein
MDVKVTVPPADYRADPEASSLWMGTGGWFHVVRKQLGDQMAFSVILSRVARDMRKVYGVEVTRQAFEGVAATMEEAAKNDLPDE